MTVFRGPARLLPPEEVAAIARRMRAGERPEVLAAEYGVSKRTIWRYRSDPDGIWMRRIRETVGDWPDAHLLTEEQREGLVAWLSEAAQGWLDG